VKKVFLIGKDILGAIEAIENHVKQTSRVIEKKLVSKSGRWPLTLSKNIVIAPKGRLRATPGVR